MKKRVLVVGSASIDLSMTLDYLPGNGQTIMGNKFKFIPGSKGAHAAVASSRLGADTVFCTRIGRDMNGEKLIKVYNDNNIDTRFVFNDAVKPTGLGVMMTEANGASRTVIYPGANTNISEDDLEMAFTCYPDALLLQFEIPEKIVIRATEHAKEQRIPVIIDASPAIRDFPLDELKNVEIFSPNESEAYLYTGIMPTDAEKSLRACQALSKIVKARYYVLKLGDRGSFVYDGKYYNVIPSYDVACVDSTAAGDAFTAALAVEYLNTNDIIKSCEFANVAGALTVSKEGAIPALPTREEVAAYVEKHGIPLFV